MPYSDTDYWKESLSIAAEECEATLTSEQLDYMANAMAGSHENYGLAFYSPPNSDFVERVEREWQAKHDALQAEFNRYKDNAEKAVHRAFNLHRDTSVSIGSHGSVEGHNGRSFNIQ